MIWADSVELPPYHHLWSMAPLPAHATCNHCYCTEGVGGIYRGDDKHLKCCKCGDVMAERFILAAKQPSK